MKPLSPIRFIKIKTFIISRAAQNVVKTSHAADTGFSYYNNLGKKNVIIDYLSYIYNAFIDPATSLGDKRTGTWQFMHQDMH